VSNPGYFKAGDRIQLTDPKGKLYSFTITPGKEWHTHKGWIVHDDLVGLPEGSVVSTSAGLKFTAFIPLLTDYVLSMPRGATIVYPKDSAMIVGFADIYPGSRVLEAGVGSGALTLSLLRAVGPNGFVHSVERREEFADTARHRRCFPLRHDQLLQSARHDPFRDAGK
jgi:tRNA (adenine57-N1/adenine58-N1)-methyltransferase